MAAAPSSSVAPGNMFILLNGQRYQVHDLDTIDSIKIRIATNEPKIMPNVPRPLLPSLISLEETEEVKLEPKVVAGCRAVHIQHMERPDANPLVGRKFKLENFFSMAILALKRAGHDPNKQKQEAKTIMDFFGLDEDDYVRYVMYFIFGGIEQFQRIPDAGVRFGFTKALDEGLGNNSFDGLRLQYDQDAKNIQSKVDDNIAASRKDLAFFTAFEHTFAETKDPEFEQAQTSPLQQDKTYLSVKFEIKTDVYELLNGMNFSPNMPFAFVGNFYKTLKTFKPPKKWATPPKEIGENPETLVMYVLNRFSEPEKNKTTPDPKNYSSVFIVPGVMDDETHTTPVEMTIKSRVDDELREDQLLARIFEAFPREFKVSGCSYEQKKVEADYLLLAPGDLDIPLFLDMIMNDPLISQLMVVDETSRTFRERGGIFFYFRYNAHVDPKKYFSCRLNIGQVEARHQARAPELFRQLGERFLSVKLLNPSTVAEAERLKGLINLVLHYYYS